MSDSAETKQLIIRVYGIWIHLQNKILLSDERIDHYQFTKFPGGGLEWGEGIKDCLQREWMEELGVEIEIGEHIYTTDYFQKSIFDEGAQIISIYYYVTPKIYPDCNFKLATFDFNYAEKEETNFRWHALSELSENDLTLPIDKIVAGILIKTIANRKD